MPFQEDLSLLEGYIIRSNQLVIPKSLRQRILELAHEGHPGEALMVTRLRDRVWWPGMDKEARGFVKQCEGCQMVSRQSFPEPMSRRRMPTEPWVDVAMDFLGPLPSGHYVLVVIDYYSRYMEVRVMTTITAERTIRMLEPIFVTHGYPRTMTLDNGRQFISRALQDYCHARNIRLNHTTPYWPQANGQVERQNSSLLKRLRISNALNRDWEADLLQYQLMYNSTRHTVTGKTPTELLRNRAIQSKLPTIKEIETIPPEDPEAHDRDMVSKYKGKEREDAKRGARSSMIQPGDTVLMKNLLPRNKLDTPFMRTRFEVLDKRGSDVTIVNKDTGDEYHRNSAHLKIVPATPNDTDIPGDHSIVEPSINDHDTPAEFHPDRFITSTPAHPRPDLHSPLEDVQPSRPRRTMKPPVWTKDFVQAFNY